MSSSLVSTDDQPITGTAGDDVLRVDTSVSFVWAPDPGNSYSYWSTYLSWDDFSYHSDSGAVPSSAWGSVTFTGVSSSEAFSLAPTNVAFSFSDGNSVTQDDLFPDSFWAWNPATGTLDPQYASGNWGDWTVTFFAADHTEYDTSHWSGSTSDVEHGHWVLAPDVHNVDVFGGAGNDTIYGGQGQEILCGDEGDDLIFAGFGDDVVFGGTGNDAIHGGVGDQMLDGGACNDTIWGGTGAQVLIGGSGNDLIWAGNGAQTVLGGAGNDTIWGGTGTQILEGGAGADILHAGNGDQTLSGGGGRDVFAFGSGISGRDTIADFVIGQDVVQVAHDIGGLAIDRPQDLAARISADAAGTAVLDLGSETLVTFSGHSAHQMIAHIEQAFRIV